MKLKQRMVAGILSFVLVLGIVGCGNKENGKEKEAGKVKEPQTEEQILDERREMVVKAMEDMLTVLWRSEADVTYTKTNDTEGVGQEESDDVLTIVKGRLYRGIPYTHGSGSGYAFLDYAISQDENGIYTISDLGAEDLSGGPSSTAYGPRIGNDCSDAMYWAWGTVSTTISFISTDYMTEDYGCLKVGEYMCSNEKLTNTVDVCKENGMDVMYKAYAKLQKGDGVVYVTDTNQSMMVSEVKIEKNDSGEIDGNKSFIKTIHQAASHLLDEKSYYDKELKEDVYYCGGIEETKYTFTTLYENGYLPITCKELIDASPLEEAKVTDSEKELAIDTMFSGTFSCPYRISDVTITITDQNGEVAQWAICYGTESEMKAFDLVRFTSEEERGVLRGEIDLDGLLEGSYKCTHVCRIATGETITVREFEFSKK